MDDLSKSDNDFLSSFKQRAQDQCVQAFSRLACMNIGDLILDDGGDLGVISLIETDKQGTLYFVLWTSGGLMGYTSAHIPREIERWSKNVRLI